MPKKYKTIVSWNVNGIRAAIRKETLIPFIEKVKPDVLCLQETKAMQGQAEIDLPEYEEIWNSAQRKGYSGTAIFTKVKPISIIFDLPRVKSGTLLDTFGDALTEGRVITVEFEEFYLVTVYTPNAKRGLERLEYRHTKWDPLFLDHVKNLQKQKPVIICGDLNVAHKEIDLARPKGNTKSAGFTFEEREGMDNLVDAGFMDTFRYFYPDTVDQYTWWSHFAKSRERNVGWRIDYFWASEKIMPQIKNAFIWRDVMGSDHCPVGIKIDTSL